MEVKIPLHVVEEIKNYCVQQDFGDDIEKESCRYCVFKSEYGCRLHSGNIGFPSDWKLP